MIPEDVFSKCKLITDAVGVISTVQAAKYKFICYNLLH